MQFDKNSEGVHHWRSSNAWRTSRIYLRINKTVVPPIDDLDTPDSRVLDLLNAYLYDERYQLHDGFAFAYRSLLEMIRDHDIRGLAGTVEPTLRKDIDEELSEHVFENIALKIENEEEPEMKVDILDFSFHIGVDINREQNRNMRIKRMPVHRGVFNRREATRANLYLNEDLELGKHLIVNLEVLVRFITNLKLNAYLENDPEVQLIPKNEAKDKEVHFVRFETVMSKAKYSLWTIFQMSKHWSLENLEKASWRITDIDNRLNDNPHVE